MFSCSGENLPYLQLVGCNIALCKMHFIIWIIFVTLGYAEPRHTPVRPIRKFIQSLSVPWVGVLSHRETKLSRETITGITLIKPKLGLVNGYDVAHISKTTIRNTTRALFLALEGVVRYATAVDYDIHPEFNEDTLNTIALVHLEYDQDKFDWLLMDWPGEEEVMMHQLGNLYAFGYVDDHEALEQVMRSMEFVNRRDCDYFYKMEDLDSPWMTPTEYECLREKFSTDKCVFESGMALAVHDGARWKLLGISVLGPGCALPARFIDFAPFVPWAQQIIGTYRNTRRSRIVRRGIHHM